LLRKEAFQETENKNNSLVQGRYPSTILYKFCTTGCGQASRMFKTHVF